MPTWKHATYFPPKASLWQLAQQDNPKPAVGLHALTTAVAALGNGLLSQASHTDAWGRLGGMRYRQKKRMIQAGCKKNFFHQVDSDVLEQAGS